MQLASSMPSRKKEFNTLGDRSLSSLGIVKGEVTASTRVPPSPPYPSFSTLPWTGFRWKKGVLPLEEGVPMSQGSLV